MSLPVAKLDLDARKALATNSLVVRGVLVQQVVEVVREHAGEEATLGFARAMQGKAAFASVGALEFLELLAEALDEVSPHGVTPDRFYEEIGRRSVFSIRGTMVSMAAGDPVRLFESLGSGPSILVAFGERKVLEVTRGKVRIAFTGSILPPRILAGMYCAMAEGVGAREAQCTSTEPAPGNTEHVITWS